MKFKRRFVFLNLLFLSWVTAADRPNVVFIMAEDLGYGDLSYYPTTNIHFPLTPNSRFKDATKAGVYGEYPEKVEKLKVILERYRISDRSAPK